MELSSLSSSFFVLSSLSSSPYEDEFHPQASAIYVCLMQCCYSTVSVVVIPTQYLSAQCKLIALNFFSCEFFNQA